MSLRERQGHEIISKDIFIRWTDNVHKMSGTLVISRVWVSIKLRLGSIKSRQNQFAALFGALSCSAGLLIQINRVCCSFISLSQSWSSAFEKSASEASDDLCSTGRIQMAKSRVGET